MAFETIIMEAVQGFQMSMIVGLIKIAITLIITGVAMAKSCNSYGTSSKVMTWTIGALAAAIVWMI